MKKLSCVLLIFALLLCSCAPADYGDATPGKPVFTTPDGRPFIFPEEEPQEITDVLLRYYFDFCRDYQVGYLPSFNYLSGERPNVNDLKRYACIVLRDELYWVDDVGTIPGDRVEQLSQDRFDLSLGLTAEDLVEYQPSNPAIFGNVFWQYSDGKERQSAAFCRLLEYRTAQIEGKTVYSVKVENYPEYYWIGINEELNLKKGVLGSTEQAAYELMQNKGMTYFEATRELAVSGKLAELGAQTQRMEFTYMDRSKGDPIFLAYSLE